MSVLVGLQHVTRYRYDRPVALGPQLIRLRPAPHCRTAIRSYALEVSPAQHLVHWQQDLNANWVARFIFSGRTAELRIAVDLIADISPINPFDFFVEPAAADYPFAYPAELDGELAPYLSTEPGGPRLTEYVQSLPRERQGTIDFIVALNRRLRGDIRYLVRMDPGVQAAEDTLGRGSGSCRDSAWLLVQVLRRLGLAARFVSGYLIQLGSAADDVADLHAWAEVYVPGAGWIGMDPTSGLLAGEGHIPLAATPHYRAAAPISGGVEPAKAEFSFEMKVTRSGETPRAA